MFDAVIIGAGPAGLTAATYLGRFHRKALVIDGNESRARWIPESHNIPGFARGIGGIDLLCQLRAQALRYGAELRSGQVSSIRTVEDGFNVLLGTEILQGSYVLLATGTRDRLPRLPGATDAILRSVMRICPICDAYEATGSAIAVIGEDDHAVREAEFLRTYSDRITLLHLGTLGDAACGQRLRRRGIEVLETDLDQLLIAEDKLFLSVPGKAARSFDVCYAALGCCPQNALATSMGAVLDDSKALVVSNHQQTSIPGLYAAGDVVRGLNQVVVAAAEAAIAATDIHNKLRTAESAHMGANQEREARDGVDPQVVK
ncbi:MAG: NAD(P)/FAD-dependent oxidoreductase [Steroidobacteraceae bacterium]